MDLDDFDYTLPPEAIAKFPLTPRDSSKLMCIQREEKTLSHRIFRDLSELLQPGDLLVRNVSRVIHARLLGSRPNGFPIEVFVTHPTAEEASHWHCLVKPGKSIKDRMVIQLATGSSLSVRREGDGFIAELPVKARECFEWLQKFGELPIPPYLDRKPDNEDKVRYQTVYAQADGSVAAPTAGLHFTLPLIEELEKKGVRFCDVVLHVGAGTFSPVRGPLSEHKMHGEFYEIPRASMELLEQTRSKGGRIIPIGTTSLRVLESISSHGLTGVTELFVQPGFEFKWTDGLITNFHLPKSTLLILVSALLGVERTRECYEEALSQGYRFYSYGDAMFIMPVDGPSHP